MNSTDRKEIIEARLLGKLNGSSKALCDCEHPAPYRPTGICAPMFPVNHCLVCGGFCKNEFVTDKGVQS